jgi:hypothetical protein
MTETEFAFVVRAAAVYGFFVHEANEFRGRVVSDTEKLDRGCFYWLETEGFDEFFEQVKTFFKEQGYDSAIRR